VTYDNRDRGALFNSDRKDGGRLPDYKGSLNFNGTECWLNVWIKTTKDGVSLFYCFCKICETIVVRTRGRNRRTASW
jgi:hypothetical protein